MYNKAVKVFRSHFTDNEWTLDKSGKRNILDFLLKLLTLLVNFYEIKGFLAIGYQLNFCKIYKFTVGMLSVLP